MGFVTKKLVIKYTTSNLNLLMFMLKNVAVKYNMLLKVGFIKIDATNNIILLRAPKVNKNAREKFFKKSYIVNITFFKSELLNIKYFSNRLKLLEGAN